MATNALPTDRYWCSVPTQELPEVVQALADAYWQRITDSGLIDLWRRSERAYYGLDELGLWKESAAVQFVGEDGEIDLVKVNHYRSILQGILAMATQERPAFMAKSVNDDTRSLMEAPIATGLIDAYWREKRLERLTTDDVEKALVYGEGYQYLRWDVHAGKRVTDPMTGQPMRDRAGALMHEGDVCPESVPPWRVVHDLEDKAGNLRYAMVAHRESIFDLVARYPAQAEQLMAQRSTPRWPDDVWQTEPWECPEREDDDRVTVWCLYHVATDSVPDGRYAIVACGVVLYDGPALIDDEVPVCPLVPARQMGRGWGHTAAWDLLPLQTLIDMAESSNATMHEAFGGYNIVVPKDAGLMPGDFGAGRRFIEVPLDAEGRMVMPQPLPLLDSPPAAYDYPDSLVQKMQTLSGMNSVARGDPDANLKSGAALALVQSLAVQFNSALQSARVQHLERVASTLLRILKANMATPRIAETAGTGASRYLREVTADQIENVDRVQMEIGSALMAQPAGRLEVANTLLDRQLVKTPEQYLQILNTGRLDPLTRAMTAALDLIAQENDSLREGTPLGPPSMDPATPGLGVDVADDHATHVREHSALLDIATRKDPKKAQTIREHILEHYKTWSQMPQDLAALTAQTVPPPQMAPPAPGGPGGPPPPKDGPKPGGPKAMGRAQPMGAPGGPDMPFMPVNPMTGDRAPAAPGAPPTPA